MTMQAIPADELHGVLSQANNDLYKEVHGSRPRWVDYAAMPTPELEALMLSLMAEAKETEAERAAEWAGFDARIQADAEAVREAVRVEAVRAHEERFMDTAAACGARGW